MLFCFYFFYSHQFFSLYGAVISALNVLLLPADCCKLHCIHCICILNCMYLNCWVNSELKHR